VEQRALVVLVVEQVLVQLLVPLTVLAQFLVFVLFPLSIHLLSSARVFVSWRACIPALVVMDG
jgi:hypothetical protein